VQRAGEGARDGVHHGRRASNGAVESRQRVWEEQAPDGVGPRQFEGACIRWFGDDRTGGGGRSRGCAWMGSCGAQIGMRRRSGDFIAQW